MFIKVVHIKNKKDIRFGTTHCTFFQTFSQIQQLLEKHGCRQIITTQNGNEHQIGFVYQEKPYLIDVPQVFIKGVYDNKIGIRIILYYLETLLELSKMRAINFNFAMLGTQMVDVDGVRRPLGEVLEKQLPIPQLLPSAEAEK